MPELHPPKKTLHFQTREYTQDLGCHAAVCMTGDGVECRMGRARHANKKRGDTRAGAAAPPATAKRGTRRASRSAREKACGGCVEPLMELPPTFFWDHGSPSATLSRPFLLGQSLHCLQMVDEWMDSGCISPEALPLIGPLVLSSSHRARQSMGETWPARGAGPRRNGHRRTGSTESNFGVIHCQLQKLECTNPRPVRLPARLRPHFVSAAAAVCPVPQA